MATENRKLKIENRKSYGWLGVAVLAFALSSVVQRHVEARRIEADMTWSDPQKNALEIGFLALGGFRGLLADILWVRAVRHQEAGRYYELKLLCDMILKLQPTFTQIHAYQAYIMGFNLLRHGETPEDKWYWLRSGMVTLEKGLERNYRNYSLWFELAYMYVDRFGKARGLGLGDLPRRNLPSIYDLTEDERREVFLKAEERKARWEKWMLVPRPPSPNEHLRYAAYCLWKSMATGTDPQPLRTERLYGTCIENLGHFWSNPKKAPTERDWDDWGSEDWWLELWRRCEARGLSFEITVADNLRNCMWQQMELFARQAEAELRAGKADAAAESWKTAQAARDRYVRYFPHKKAQTLEQLLKEIRDEMARQAQARGNTPNAQPVEP